MLPHLAAALLLYSPNLVSLDDDQPMLMQHPTMNSSTIVFAFSGDLWSVPRAGGSATRLTSSAGTEAAPSFSPDGKSIAFTGEYDGNTDVFIMPAGGGVPKRLTYQPTPDQVLGWTPDGKSVLFASPLLSNTDLPRLFTVAIEGSLPVPLPLPSGSFGSYSVDGSMIA